MNILTKADGNKNIFVSKVKSMKTENYHLAKMLIKSKIRLNEKDYRNNNALMIAIEKNQLDIITILVNECEFNIEEPCYKGHNALTLACKLGRTDIIKFLLSKNANKKHLTITGSDALIYASMYGFLDIVKLLIDEYSTFVKNNSGCDSLLYACRYGHIDIVQY